MNFEIYDMLVFEDESGSIYQDCVCEIRNKYVYEKCIVTNTLFIYLNDNDDIVRISPKDKKYKLKEIWTRTDEDTYKKVYELVDGKLTKISYSQGMKVYHRRQEVTYDQIKKFMVKDEESMGE